MVDCLFLLISVYLILLFFVKPYKKKIYNKIDLISLAVCMTSLYSIFFVLANVDSYWLEIAITDDGSFNHFLVG